MIETYVLPVNVTIEADDTDHIIKRIAETIHDSVEDLFSDPEEGFDIKYLDMTYSITKKMHEEELKDK